MHYLFNRALPSLTIIFGISLFFPITLTVQSSPTWYGGDFLYSSFYCFEIFLIPILLLSLWKHLHLTSHHRISPYVVLALCCLALGAVSYPLELTHLLQVRFLFYGLLLFLMFFEQVLSVKTLLWGLIIGLGLQLIPASIQVMLGHSMGLHPLGESLLAISMKGVAKFNILHTTLLRGYGTLPHPNILGALGFSTLLLLFTHRHRWKGEPTYIIIIAWLIVLLSLSKSFIVATFFISLVYWNRHRLRRFSSKHLFLTSTLMFSTMLAILSAMVVVLGINNSSFVIDRLAELQPYFFSILGHPFGFDIVTPLHGIISPWDIMPIHNTYLVSFQSYGWIGGAGFFVLISYFIHLGTKSRLYSNHNITLLYLFPLLFLLCIDHLWLSFPPLHMVLWIILASSIVRLTYQS